MKKISTNFKSLPHYKIASESFEKYTLAYIYIHMNAHTHKYTFVGTHIKYIYICTYMHSDIHIHMCAHIYAHTGIHKHAHTGTHTFILLVQMIFT